MNCKNIILGLFAVFAFSSCEDFFEQTVEVDVPEHNPVLAVTANFTDRDSSLRVFVSHTVGILDSERPSYISDATVELFKNGELLHTFVYETNGSYWMRNITPLGNEIAKYTLKISAPNYESVEAIQTMPTVAELTSVSYEEDGTLDEFGERVNEVTLNFNDPAGVANYYFNEFVIFYPDGQGGFSRELRYLDSIDPLTEYGDKGAILNDVTFDGDTHILRLYSYAGLDNQSDIEVYVRLLSVTRERYLHSKSLQAYYNAEDNPFAEPAVLFSNINGGEGQFTLSAISEMKLEL